MSVAPMNNKKGKWKIKKKKAERGGFSKKNNKKSSLSTATSR